MQLLSKTAPLLTNSLSFGAYFEPIVQLVLPRYRANKISATVTHVSSDANNIYTLTLQPNSRKWKGFTAGQFVQVEVCKNGTFYNRSFSISSAPSLFKAEGKIQISFKAHAKGMITPWMAEHLHVGATIYLSPAMGDFCLSDTLNAKLFIAAGSGLTPFLSMLEDQQNTGWFKQSTLLYFVRTPDDVPFTAQLAAFRKNGLTVKIVYTATEGHLQHSHLNRLSLPLDRYEAYICGPGQMISNTQDLLIEGGIEAHSIHFEYFGSKPLPNADQIVASNSSNEAIKVDFMHSNKLESWFSSQPKSLLELAESSGLKPVSGCRIGVCHQCTCRKKSGRVYNIKTGKYSDSGEENIQLCQSIPVDNLILEL